MYAFWEIIASNAVVATILAIGVMLLGRIWKNAAAVHALWVVVLLKLFTPPLITTELPFAFHFVPPAEGADSQKATLNSPARDEAKATAPVAMTDSRGAIAAGNPQPALGNRSTETAGLEPWSLSTDPRRNLDWRRLLHGSGPCRPHSPFCQGHPRVRGGASEPFARWSPSSRAGWA